MGTPPPIQLATFGMWDTLILMVIALVVFGPRRLPQIGRQIGKLMYEFRKASNDFKFQMEEELRAAEEADRRKKEEEERQRALSAAPPPQLEQPAPSASETSSGSGESEATASAPAVSPYPDEVPYPDLAAETAQSEETHPRAAKEASPRIQPPSTGETIAANRPGTAPESAATQAERPHGHAQIQPPPAAAAEQTSAAALVDEPAQMASNIPVQNEAAAGEPRAVTEPAPRHG